MTSKRLLRDLKKLGSLSYSFQFPFLQVLLKSTHLRGLSEVEGEAFIAEKLGISINELRSIERNNLLSLRYEDDSSPDSLPPNRGYHWLPEFISPQTALAQSADVRTIHFYGYKGGQARSTVMTVTSRELANMGHRVLVVDADIEAPSLEVIYARQPRSVSSTLLGLQDGASTPTSENVYVQPGGRGVVDAIFCRPSEREYDIDATAFALHSALNPQIIEDIARRIAAFAAREEYAIVLVDHRSGLSPAIIPWIKVSAGPVCIFSKLDEQWTPAKSYLSLLLRNNPDNPGLFVSWQPDDEKPEQYIGRNQRQIESLLEILVHAVQLNNPEEELYPSDIQDHWLLWPYDPAFRDERLPENAALSTKLKDTVSSLISLLELPVLANSEPVKNLTISGATDESSLIQTEAIRELSVQNSPIRFIVGRKGTGKTRLLRHLVESGRGIPLLVDNSDLSGHGFKSGSPELVDAARRYDENPIMFWFHLVSASLHCPSPDSVRLIAQFKHEIDQYGDEDVASLIARLPGGPRRTLLIDGIETAFRGRQINRYVDGLFAALLASGADARLRDLVEFRVFLRADMIGTVQNVEQQMAGRTIRLSWDTKSILNFVLLRISETQWFEINFPDAIAKIAREKEHIIRGQLSVESCEDILMLLFPMKLRRNNLFTKTFLKTYFADSASERVGLESSLRYYPRIFAQFLEYISDPTKMPPGAFTGSQLEDQRISQRLIFAAHDAAASDYLEQIKAELVYLLDFQTDLTANSEAVSDFLTAFNGMQTPFEIDTTVERLATKLNETDTRVRQAMERMRSVGIFEYRPEYETQWRVGRLFKSSLRMKYDRGQGRATEGA